MEHGLRHARRLVPARTVIVHGYYGKGNAGDEAILASTLQSIREATSCEPVVFAWDPARVRADFGVASLDPRVSEAAAFRALLGARAFLLGGGGLIKDYGADSASLFRWMRWIDHAHRLGVATMTWSVGVGCVVRPESKRRVREVLSGLDAITVRDEPSAQRLRDLGVAREVRVTADPVVRLARAWRKRRDAGDRLRVVACPRALFTETNEVTRPAQFDRLLDAFGEALDHAQGAHGAHVTLLPFHTGGRDDDREVSRRIVERMQVQNDVEVIETENPTPAALLGHLCRADLQIGMRLHSTVMATSLGVPSVAVAYLPKVRGFMEALGQGAFCADVEAATGGWMSERVDAALASRDRLGAALRAETDRMARAYAENDEILSRLVALS